MNEATIALVVMSVLISLIFVGFLVWGIKSGQFKNVEEAKYQLFKTSDSSSQDVRGKQPEGEKK